MSNFSFSAAYLGSNISTQHLIIPYAADDVGKNSVLSSVGFLSIG
jgi:hypothetical protein